MASETRRKDELPGITESIVETYESVGTINHLDHSPLPRYEEVITALEDMREILFPGYRRREGLHLGNVGYYIGDLIDGLHDRFVHALVLVGFSFYVENIGLKCTTLTPRPNPVPLCYP